MAEKVKFQFNGQIYGSKGRLCHDIVKYYAEQNPNATLPFLQKTFNTATHMIVVTPEMALAVINSDGKAGGDYYMKEADQISIMDGKVVVWSYWPESYFKPFMEQVKALGLVVVEQGAKCVSDGNTKETIAESLPSDSSMLPFEEAPNGGNTKLEPKELALQLDELIEAALADGVLSEKEKRILFKKAQAIGVDLDEFEMVLGARLFEKQQGEAIHADRGNPNAKSTEDAKKYIMGFRKKFDEAEVYAPTGKYGKNELVYKDTYIKKQEVLMTEIPPNPECLREFLLFLENINDYGCLRKAMLLIDDTDKETLKNPVLKTVVDRFKKKYRKERLKYVCSKIGGIVCLIVACGVGKLVKGIELGFIFKSFIGILEISLIALGFGLCINKNESWIKLWLGRYN